MRLTTRVDLALRAVVELGASPEVLSGHELARRQAASYGFLVAVLSQLRAAGIVRSSRGREGGFSLSRPASEISLADVIRAVDGPLALIAGDHPEQHGYSGAALRLQDVWFALREHERAVLENVTVADVAQDTLPPEISSAAARGRAEGIRMLRRSSRNR